MHPLHLRECSASQYYGKIEYVHNGVESAYTAFDINEAATIRILLPRILGVVSVRMELFNESLSIMLANQKSRWYSIVDGFDAYDISIDNEEIGAGLFFFRFVVKTADSVYFGVKDGDRIKLTDKFENDPLFQLSICSFQYSIPENKLGGIIYHIFVDRFNRGGQIPAKDGAILVDDWSSGIPEYPAYPGAELKNNRFYGGTLWGIIDKLEYISSLGVNTIYLSPVFDAASNHKYDTSDYMTVDSMFGGDEALVALIDKAKEYGIGIILDGVFNHTGADSIYFNKYNHYDSLGAYQSKNSEYYPWYDFQSYPDKYTCWWNIDILPRINPDILECRNYFVGNGGVVEKYARLGIDGFRLDVVDELSDDFVSAIKFKLNESNSQSVLYGEVWEDASNKVAYGTRKRYYLGNELDGVMNYPLRNGLIDYFTYGATGKLRYALTDIVHNAPKRISDMQMNLLGTHDTERIITLLGGESSRGRSNSYLAKKRMNDIERGTAKRRLRMAYTVLATLPGIPTIFYGDETALEGYHDPFNRMPYPWGRQDIKLIDFYRLIGRIRRENSVYKDGDFRLLVLESTLLIFSRSDDSYSYITYVNNSGISRLVEFDCDGVCLTDNSMGSLFTVPAYSSVIIKCKKGSTLISD